MFKVLLPSFLLISVLLNPFSTVAQQTIAQQPDSLQTVIITPDDHISAMLDSLAQLKIFQSIDARNEQIAGQRVHPRDFVPVFPDSVIAQRIRAMNDRSPFQFVFNDAVRSFIDLYANRRRSLTERMLGMAQLYFPLFEEQLDRHNVPLELKYVAIIESALNPTARSRVGATGLWQFMFHTGRMYGLEVNSFVDDRMDVIRSTIAAAEHLVDLYEIYGDWKLVLAAYNAGPGNVNRAIRRAGGVKDFWKISPFLPRETRNYVPAFIAVAYVMQHAQEHNLFPIAPRFSYFEVDTIKVHQEISLRSVSQFTGLELDVLRYLNPTFRQNIIPRNENNPYVLRIPSEYTPLFLANQQTIQNYRTADEVRQQELAAQMEETTVHIVRSGEVLGSIARRYGTTVGQIQRLNNLRGTTIRPGQRLVVNAPAGARQEATASTASVHTVRSGDTLTEIAARYGVTVRNLLDWNNLSSSNIRVGQRLRVRQP